MYGKGHDKQSRDRKGADFDAKPDRFLTSAALKEASYAALAESSAAPLNGL